MLYINVLKRYFDFVGRTGRREFWLFQLIHFIVVLALSVVDFGVFYGFDFEAVTDETFALYPIATIYGLAVALPMLGLGARRLHDIGRSGWWQFLHLIPLIGTIVLIIWAIMPSDPQENSHGALPM